MLTRSKTVLATLQLVERPLSSLVLTKLVFLLRYEGGLSRLAGFYQFVPYKFGPYSFALRNDLDALQRNGYLEATDDKWRLGHSVATERNWLTGLDAEITKAVRFIVETWGSSGREKLLRHVYAKYPWFASRSELCNHTSDITTSSPDAPPAVYTIGYQQRTIDGLLADLLEGGIRTIIDVRANPVSRNYGFARRTLAKLAERVGLGYYHFPELGIPSENRKNLRSENAYYKLFQDYRENILPNQEETIDKVARIMKGIPSVLLCYEANAQQCHRRPLAEEVARRSKLPIVELPCQMNGKQFVS